MPARKPRTPSYRHHRPSGQAVVTIDGRDIYLGKHDTPASRAEYDRVLAEWLTNGRRHPTATDGTGHSDMTVGELILAYLRHAEGYYRKEGQSTSEVANITLALRPLRRLYGDIPARDFGPKSLKAVRQAMIEADLCRREVNKRVRHVIRAFAWAVSEELVPSSIHHGLKSVSGLHQGRSEARESEPVKPVPEAYVEAVRPHVAPQLWAMIELQRLAGMRSGEVTIMRPCDLDTSDSVWAYTPRRHKTQHHGRQRVIFLGPRAQGILKPWLRTDLSAYLFSPAEIVEQQLAERRRARVTPMTPSQRARRRVTKRERPPGEHYTAQSYGRAIATACRRAGIPRWHPHQLRHNAATWLRKEFGLDVARVILGHSSTTVTEVYAELDRTKAIAVMEQAG